MIKRILLVLGIVIGGVLILVWRLPAAWIIEPINRAAAPVQLLQIEGTVWEGKARLVTTVAQMEMPLQWDASRLDGGGVQWAIKMADNHYSYLRYKEGNVDVEITSLPLPVSLFAKQTQAVLAGRGALSGTVMLSGIVNVNKALGNGQIKYQNIALENAGQSLLLGEGNGIWECVSASSQGQRECKLTFQPGAPLHLQGQLIMKEGMLSGAGALHPSDPTLVQALRLMPASLIKPIELNPLGTGASSAHGASAWNWQLPEGALHF